MIMRNRSISVGKVHIYVYLARSPHWPGCHRALTSRCSTRQITPGGRRSKSKVQWRGRFAESDGLVGDGGVCQRFRSETAGSEPMGYLGTDAQRTLRFECTRASTTSQVLLPPRAGQDPSRFRILHSIPRDKSSAKSPREEVKRDTGV